MRRRELPPIPRLAQIGRLLIAVRIARGFTQHPLAERAGISEAQVSRDERNEYHGIAGERAQRILDALNETVIARVEEPGAREGEVAASAVGLPGGSGCLALYREASIARRSIPSSVL